MFSKWNKFFESDLKWYLIAITPITSIFFIIPFELYFNAKEYWNWNTVIPVSFALSGIFLYLFLSVIIAVFLKISPKFSIYISICLFYIGIFVLLADVFSPLQTSLLDGSELLSKEPLMYTVIEAAIFVVIIVAALKLGSRSSVIIALPISVILIVISAVYFGLIVTSSKPVIEKSNNQNLNLNIRGNVYHILLDEMQTDAATIYLMEENAYKHFSGFTLFKNNISNYLYTRASFPSYITGSLYSGGSFGNWLESFKSKGLLRQLYDYGYNIVFFSPRRNWCNPYMSECVSLDDIYEEVAGIKNAGYKDFIQIWYARIMPNFYTNKALAIGKELWKFFRGPANLKIPRSISEGKEPFTSVLMLKELIKTEKSRPADGQYIYAHTILPHGPYVMNANGEYNPDLRYKGTSGYYEQIKCAFNLVIELIEELKRLGRYDKATIIIHADTGHAHRGFICKEGSKLIGTVDSRGNDRQMPFLNNQLGWTKDQLLARIMALLMIKPAYSTGELSFSDRESQLTDLYPTILDLLKIHNPKSENNNTSLYSKDFSNNRPSIFFLYPPGKTDPNMVKISINNRKNLTKSDLNIEGNINKYSAIDFPIDGISFNIGKKNEWNLQLKGFSGNECNPDKSFNWCWATGKHSEMIFRGFQLRKSKKILVTFRVMPFVVNINNKMTIETPLFHTNVTLKSGWNEYIVILDFPAGLNPTLKFHYEDSASPISLGLNNDTRTLSVAWDKISLKYAE